MKDTERQSTRNEAIGHGGYRAGSRRLGKASKVLK